MQSILTTLLEQYRGASATMPPPSVEEDYSKVAPSAPQSHLADGLASAFRSSETPPFAEMLGRLFANSDGQQRAGILQQLLGSVAPTMLASGTLGGLAGLLRGGTPQLTPEQANQISPETVQHLAEHAEQHNPSIVEQASQFYAQHPTLVKALGAGSLALIMSHMSQRS